LYLAFFVIKVLERAPVSNWYLYLAQINQFYEAKNGILITDPHHSIN
jgi:hypothetical protein